MQVQPFANLCTSVFDMNFLQLQNIFRLHATSFILLQFSTVTLSMDVVSLNSCWNKEYILIGQIFDRTLPIFQFSNVQLQHKNGQTCLMTDCYLHHCINMVLSFSIRTQNGHTCCKHEEKNIGREQPLILFKKSNLILMFFKKSQLPFRKAIFQQSFKISQSFPLGLKHRHASRRH